jgi:hypothetical protein
MLKSNVMQLSSNFPKIFLFFFFFFFWGGGGWPSKHKIGTRKERKDSGIKWLFVLKLPPELFLNLAMTSNILSFSSGYLLNHF